MSRQTTTRRRHGVRRMSERKRLTITAISAVLALVTVVICALTGVFNRAAAEKHEREVQYFKRH